MNKFLSYIIFTSWTIFISILLLGVKYYDTVFQDTSLNFKLLFWGLILVSLLFHFGLIGPASVRKFMREWLRKVWYEKALFFPIDTDKSAPDALREGWDKKWPNEQRIKEHFHFKQLILVLGGFIIAAILVLVVIFVNIFR